MADVELRIWAAQSGPARFLTALYQRFERQGEARNPLAFRSQPLSLDEQIELRELFGGALSATSVNLRLAEERLLASRFAIDLRELVSQLHGPIVTRSEKARIEEERGRRRVSLERRELLACIASVPQLQSERQRLEGLPLGTTSQVPEGTATQSKRWSSYAKALRAAAVWWGRQDEGHPTHERALAASAFGNSKGWTDASRLAFANLVGMPFDQAVLTIDKEVRLRGPLRWTLDGVIANAQLARPWVSIPARGALTLGHLEASPEGVLLIENQENFARVCELPDVAEHWLCVWLEGFAGHGLITFVGQFPDVPLAAWCDLDPSGIEIIQNIETRTSRRVHPIGMDVEYWEKARKLDEGIEEREEWKKKARRLMASGPSSLRDLAALIAVDGLRVEQETLVITDSVLPALWTNLQAIGRSPGGNPS